MGEKAGFVLFVGGALVAIGSFLPWMSASSIFGTITVSGMNEGDGWLTLAGGVVIALIGGALASGNQPSRFQRPALWNALVVVVIIWIFNFLDIRDAIDSVDSEFVSGSVGYGMWIMAVGGVVALVGILNLPASTEPEGSRE